MREKEDMPLKLKRTWRLFEGETAKLLIKNTYTVKSYLMCYVRVRELYNIRWKEKFIVNFYFCYRSFFT